MLKTIYFSPTGGTKRVVDFLAEQLDIPSEPLDLTVNGSDNIDLNAADDVALFAAPVYAGRIPALARDRFSNISSNGRPAIVVAVYGNRDYDDALIELCDLVELRGFRVVAAAAFIACHSIFPAVGSGRPDAEDKEKMSIFAGEVTQAIREGRRLDLSAIPGRRPYRRPGAVPLYPSTLKSLCNECGACALQCPTGAIPKERPDTTDRSKCISCARCIMVCPRDARHFRGLLYRLVARRFNKKYALRRDPVWFI